MPTPPSAADHSPLGVDLTRTGRLIASAFDQALTEAGGSLPTWLVLMTLARDSGSIQREIAAAIGIEGATLTHHLNRMEADGLVTRTRVPTNRRMHQVELTNTGQALFHTLLERVIAFDAQLRAGLSSAEEATLRSLLARLRANSVEQPPPGSENGQEDPS